VITSKLRHTVLYVVLILAGSGAARGPYTNPNAGPDLLAMVPAESVFCLRIENLGAALNAMDQFIDGLTPMPYMISALVDGQLGGLLSDPQLGGIDMNGKFGAFALPIPGADPNQEPFFAFLVPVTDYSRILAAQNITPPDGRGVSQVQAAVQNVPPMVMKQVGAHALVTDAQYSEMLVTVADSISSGRAPSFATLPAVADPQLSAAPVWIHITRAGLTALTDQAFSTVSAQMGAAGPMPGPMGIGAEPAMPMGPDAAPPMPMDSGEMSFNVPAPPQDIPVQSLTLGLFPSADLLTIMTRVTAVPGSGLAQQLVKGSLASQAIFQLFNAAPPAQMGPRIGMVTALLPQATTADAVGTYDLMQLGQMATAMIPMPLPIELPQNMPPSRSRITYAVTVNAGNLALDLALPKQHVVEIVNAVKAAAEKGATAPTESTMIEGLEPDPTGLEVEEPDDEISQITGSPFANLTGPPPTPVTAVTPTRTATAPAADGPLFEGLLTEPTREPARTATETDANVRVAGARLVRYSDMELGVLPLGHADGYTLSLIAALPAPAVKISGGQVEKAMTNTGDSLLPKHQWDRRVRLARLSRDLKTAIFDIELTLPEPGVLGLQELAGTIEFLTATGTKDVDLGLMDIKVGQKATDLGAKITSIERDPYGNNPPVVGITLQAEPETIQAIEIYRQDDTPLKITQRGRMSLAGTTKLKFSLEEDELPKKARIVVHTFDGLQKNELPFRITGISLAGQPMR